MFTFNDEYVLKSMLASVRDEGNRIVSLGLATHDQLKGLIEPALRSSIKEATDGIRDKSVLTSTLTRLHKDLSAVFLPGDFEKIAGTEGEQMFQMLDMPFEDEAAGPEDLEAELEAASEEDEDEDEESYPGPLELLSTLENLAYSLGKTGNHKAAYLVERKMRKIEAMISEAGAADMFGEMEKMEKNPPRNTAPQQRMQQQYQARQQQQAPQAPQQNTMQSRWNAQQQANPPAQQQKQQPRQKQVQMPPAEFQGANSTLMQAWAKSKGKPPVGMEGSRLGNTLRFYYKQTGDTSKALQMTKQRFKLQ